MSIEEKAKAYDEALDRAYGIRYGNHSSGTAIVVCEQIFPELRESEDEKIRIEIRTYLYNELHNISQLTPRTNTFERWLAYLEKQKEQKPVEWSEEDEKNIEKLSGFLSEVFCYGHVYISQKEKEELQLWLKQLRKKEEQ